MSQLRLSLRQMFPRGDSLRLARSQERARAREERARRDLALREIVLDVRSNWLEQRYWELAREQTLQRLSTLEGLSGVLLAAYAAGRENSHEVIRSDLETQILQSRLTEIDQQADMARARLARYLGDDALHRPASMSDVRLPALPDGQEALSSLARHPAVAVIDARIEAHETGVELAEQQYHPAWGVEAGYGLRFGRSDTATIGVSFEMPLFERTRQDETVLAARDEVAAAEYSRQALLLDLRRTLQIEQARIDRLDAAIALQRSGIIPAARETREAVLLAYENQTADYSELVRSELALLDAELTLFRLETDRSVAASQILYLTGDVQ
ncbi:MAG: TolC family protein [Rhodospirillales bacterium]